MLRHFKINACIGGYVIPFFPSISLSRPGLAYFSSDSASGGGGGSGGGRGGGGSRGGGRPFQSPPSPNSTHPSPRFQRDYPGVLGGGSRSVPTDGRRPDYGVPPSRPVVQRPTLNGESVVASNEKGNLNRGGGVNNGSQPGPIGSGRVVSGTGGGVSSGAGKIGAGLAAVPQKVSSLDPISTIASSANAYIEGLLSSRTTASGGRSAGTTEGPSRKPMSGVSRYAPCHPIPSKCCDRCSGYMNPSNAMITSSRPPLSVPISHKNSPGRVPHSA